jgi:hypothetical protein
MTGTSASPARVPPPPFWRTPYFASTAMLRPDRRNIEAGDIVRAISQPARSETQAVGRVRFWYYVTARGKWLRVITESDGETVHNAFWDRRFRP